jgi:hypothetical protein
VRKLTCIFYVRKLTRLQQTHETLASSNSKHGHHDIIDKLLKVT